MKISPSFGLLLLTLLVIGLTADYASALPDDGYKKGGSVIPTSTVTSTAPSSTSTSTVPQSSSTAPVTSTKPASSSSVMPSSSQLPTQTSQSSAVPTQTEHIKYGDPYGYYGEES
ncbi:hypothetical protein BKA69DRAFT_1047723 [Paraphysoderma sedebokerense]|nr:hypothetical protein BKA69DRAFT_1047723 [Paraphysoderma sedebokerense]